MLKIARQTFEDPRNPKNYLKSAKRTASCDNRAFNLLHTFFGGPTFNIYKKKGIKF